MTIQGALGARLIDHLSGSTLGAAGRGAGTPDEAAAAARMVQATLQTAAFATPGQAERVEDIVIAASNGYHLLRLLPGGHGGRLVLYVWLDRVLGNLAVAQRRLASLSTQFTAG